MQILETLSLNKFLRIISLMVFAALLIVGGVGIAALQKVSSAASLMGQGKDVVADILPPPLYVIEAQLVAYDIARASADRQPALIEKIHRLRKEYDERNTFWSATDLDAGVKQKLLGEQRRHADLFWAEVDKKFLPAVAAQDPAGLEASLRQMRQHYDAHRAGVEDTVGVANRFADATLHELMDSSRTNSAIAIIASLLGCALVLLGMKSLATSLNHRIGGEPAVAVEVATRIAQGDLSGAVPVQPGDSSSMLAAMKLMQDNLSGLVDDIRHMVRAAGEGDLGQRIKLGDKKGFGREIALALNQLMVVTDTSLQDVSRVVSALAAGDLSQRLDTAYPGAFGKTADAVNATVSALIEIIEEVRTIVDAAAQGDFAREIDTSSKQGYPKTLIDLLNSLSTTARRALFDISSVSRSLAEGDLTHKIDASYPGLFGKTADGLNATVARLQVLIGDVVGAVDAISTAAHEISAGNNDLSVRTDEQASSLEETAASIRQFAATTQRNTESARQANLLGQSAAEIARRGGEIVNASVVTMHEIRDSSRLIGDIIGVIEGISFQTNILALNAAVEAARAGEHGKGFAVVASEVRALSLRTAEAAKEISALIRESANKVEDGASQAEDAGRSMNEIMAAIARLSDLVAAISAASVEQATGIRLVDRAVTQMDGVTQQNSAQVEQAAAAANALEEQAQNLKHQVATFKLGHDGLAAAPKRVGTSLHAAPTAAHGRAKLLGPAQADAEWSAI